MDLLLRKRGVPGGAGLHRERLIKVVPKGAFAPLLGDREIDV